MHQVSVLTHVTQRWLAVVAGLPGGSRGAAGVGSRISSAAAVAAAAAVASGFPFVLGTNMLHSVSERVGLIFLVSGLC